MNSISFFEHRLKNALISQLEVKINSPGQCDPQKKQLHRFTTKELLELNRTDSSTTMALLTAAQQDPNLVRRQGVDRLIKNIRRERDAQTLIAVHQLTDPEVLNRLQFLTHNALKFFNMLPLDVQDDLLSQLQRSRQPRVWNGSFIKGYYFLSKILESEEGNPYFLKDLKFHTDQQVKVLFSETLYEIFGNFVYIDKQQLYVTSGIAGMARMLKDIKHDSVIKGLFGELIAAYYYKKAFDMEILEFQKKIDTSRGTVGEIDIIAMDKNYVLWDIEVKNWHVTSLAATETLLAKVTEQLRSRDRHQFVLQLKQDYERLRHIKIQDIRQRAILVKDTPYKTQIHKLQQQSAIIFDVVDLVPEWLTKGIYDPGSTSGQLRT